MDMLIIKVSRNL